MPGERFHVRLVPDEGGAADRVVAEVGLEGFNVLSADGGRVLRKYPLHHISRWSMRGSSLILFTKSPVDVEDRTVTLQGDEHTIRSVLDTLTCSCMQMAELLQSGQSTDGAGRAAATSLNALLKKSKKPTLLTADQVEFWHHPEKAGWMFSQGEHIRTWRKRWFVLKQGFLFRFASAEVAAATKPRGIVDLSHVTDVADGSEATKRPNSVRLSTATGRICYLTESETAQVEWVSALEGAVARIVKLVAGVEDDSPERASAGGSGGASASGSGRQAGVPKSWAEQLERNFASAGGSTGGGGYGGGGRSGGGGGGGGSRGEQLVRVVNYSEPTAPPQGRWPAQSEPDYGGGGGYVSVDYGSIAGASALPERREGSGTYNNTGGGGGGYPAYSQQPQQAAYPQQGSGAYPQLGQQQQAAAPPPMQQQAPPAQQQQAADYGYGAAAGNGGYAAAAPTLFDAVTAPQAPPPASASPWQVHYTAEGRPYYYNNVSGLTQWDTPA